MSADLVENGKSNWSLTTISEGRAITFAASELRRYFREISGCDLPDGSAERSIVLDLREELPQEDQACLPAAKPGYDGYAISMTPDRVVIGAGNARGAIYAVYDLLERIGCRWFYPTQDPRDPEVVPRLETIRLQPGRWAVASPIRYRVCNGSAWFFEIDPILATRQLDWAMKCRYNTMGWQCDHRSSLYEQYRSMESGGVIRALRDRDMLLHGPAHSFNHFLPNDLFDEHPEWFGMRDGKRVKQEFAGSQFCWSNAEARAKLIDNAAQFLTECPLDILCTIGIDGGPPCACPECARSTPSDLIVTLMNELVVRLEESAPGVVVETSGGYHPIHEPPRNTKLHPKLRVVWAHWGRYHGSGYDDETYDWRPNLDAWREAVNGQITPCQYYTDNFAEPWVAAPYAIALEGDRRYMLQHGVDGWYMLMYPLGYWWNHSLNGYLGGVCLYDPSIDPYEAIHDYARRYFGSDAGPLLGAYYEQWAREIHLAYRVRDDAEDGDRAMLATQRREWIDPAVSAVQDDPVLSHRVGKVEKLHRAAEMLAQVPLQRQRIQSLRESGDSESAKRLLSESREYTDRVLAYLNELADLDQGLIDKNEIPSFIRMKLKDWIEEETKLLEACKQTATTASSPS